MKLCNKCGLKHPETNFSKDRNARDGLQYVCKECRKAYRSEHREQIIEYREQNREQRIEYDKQYRFENKEHIIERNKQYHAEHREHIIERQKQYHFENREAMQKACATWSKNHPEAMRAYTQTRRAMKAGLASTLTSSQWNRILGKFNNLCAYCGSGDKALTQEHFIPLSGGGEYTHDNIIPTCKSCNSSKGNKDFFAWYPTSKGYDKQREKKIMKFLHYTGSSQQLTLCT